MESIFVVEHGERCEGGSVVSLHKSHEKAVEAALKVEPCFDGGWKQDGTDCWINGCDYVKVTEHSLQE